MNLKYILIGFIIAFASSFSYGQDAPPKEDTQKEGNRPPRGGKGNEGRPQGKMTKEMWLEFSEKMPKVGKISGKVIDEKSGEPIEYATIGLLLQLDSSVITGTITNEKGLFVMEELPIGRFIVSVEFMGYETQNFPDIRLNPRRSPEVDLGTISLDISSEMMGEVVVQEEKPFIELQLDKKIVNVEDNLTVAGGTATDVLEQVPSVEVDIDGNINLRGSQNITILIDGRPTAMAGSSPADILEQIPAESIEKIEIITNPSAKYDPDGMAGILNIILKKNKKIGLTGNVSANWQFLDLNEYSFSGNLGYRNQKVNVYTNYSYRDNEREFYRLNYRLNTLTDTIYSFDQDGDGARRRKSHVFKTGLDFYPNSSSTIYTSVQLGFQKGNDYGENLYYYFDENSIWSHLGINTEVEKESERDKSFSLGYQKRFNNKWDHLLEIDFNYSDDNEEETSDLEQGEYDLDYNLDDLYIQNDITNSYRQSYQGRIDYERPFDNKSKLEVGAKSIVRFRDEEFISSNPILDNQFQFDEQIHAIYSTYAYPVTEKFSIKGGLRLEQAVTDGKVVNSNETFHKNYFSWFPSLTLSQDLGEKGQMSLSYSRRINRPRSRQINPFLNYSDPLNFRKGNPDLNPEYTSAIEYNYMKRWDKITFMPSLYYRHTTGIINRYRTVDSEGVSTMTYINLSQAHAYGIELVTIYKPFKWWRLMPSFDLNQTILDAGNLDADLNTTAFRVSGRLVSNMTFWKNMELQMFFMYRAPSKIAQGEMKSIFFGNIGLKKKILNDKGSIGISIRDPFATGKFRFITEGDTFYQEGSRQREPYIATLTFSYRFGKQERNKRNKNDRDRGNSDSGFDDMMD